MSSNHRNVFDSFAHGMPALKAALQEMDLTHKLAGSFLQNSTAIEAIRGLQNPLSAFNENPLMKAMREMEERTRRLTPLFEDPPAMKAWREMEERTRKMAALFEEPPAMKAMREMEESNRRMASVFGESTWMKAFRESQASFKSLSGVMDSPAMKAFREMEEPTRQMANLFADSPMMQSIRRLEESFRSVSQLSAMNAFQLQPAFVDVAFGKLHAIQGELAEYGQIEALDDDQDVEQQLSDFVDFLIGSISQASSKLELRALISFVGWVIPILISFYLFALSSKDTEGLSGEISTLSSEVRTQRVQLAELTEQVSRFIDEAGNTTFYLVIRPVPLNYSQRFLGNAYFMLYPAQEVELIAQNGKWIKVSAINLYSGQKQTGWVLKKYLKRVQ